MSQAKKAQDSASTSPKSAAKRATTATTARSRAKRQPGGSSDQASDQVADVPVSAPSEAVSPQTVVEAEAEAEAKTEAQAAPKIEAKTETLAPTPDLEQSEPRVSEAADGAAPESDPMAVLLSVDQAALIQAMGRAVAATDRGANANPTLKNLVIEADQMEQRLTITGFNGRIGLQCTIKATVKQSGSFIVSADFAQLINRMPESAVIEIDSTQGSNKLLASCIGITYEERIASTDDYPELPSLDSNRTYEIDAGELSRGLRAVKFAASKQEDKVLNGILFELWSSKGGGTDGFCLSAADGAVMATYKVIGKAHDISSPDIQMLLPMKALDAIEKMSFMAGTLYCVCDREGKLLCLNATLQQDETYSDVRAVVRLRDGVQEYPKFRALWPKPESASSSATVDYQQFSSALTRQEAIRAEYVMLEVSFDFLEIKTVARVGRALSEQLNVKTRCASKIPVGLANLLGATGGLEAEMIHLYLDSSAVPANAAALVQDEDEDWRLLMQFADTPLEVVMMRVVVNGNRQPSGSGAAKSTKGKSTRKKSKGS